MIIDVLNSFYCENILHVWVFWFLKDFFFTLEINFKLQVFCD